MEDRINQSEWYDWKWQQAHCVRSLDDLNKLEEFDFSESEQQELERVFDKFPMSITPYYLSLIDKSNFRNDPIFKQAVGSINELIIEPYELNDPLEEELDSPTPGITHRYPDRVLFYVSSVCAMYCRHCTRKRKVGDVDSFPSREKLQKGIDYIKAHPEVRDVLISGGDPLMLSDDKLDWVLSQIRAIPHVEIIRIGSRIPVVMPYRITPKLVRILKKYHPLWINTHFNHPNEFTPDSEKALKLLADAGFPLGNQSVLLAGVNDDADIIKKLCHLLVKNRVRPYYLYQCDMSEGLSHFRTPISKGMEIMERLVGHTSGLAVPRYVVDAPGGGGKIPLMPNYYISASPTKHILRNYEGVICIYYEPDNYVESVVTQIKPENAIGLEKLFCKCNEIYSLVPGGNKRMKRRHD